MYMMRGPVKTWGGRFTKNPAIVIGLHDGYVSTRRQASAEFRPRMAFLT